MAKGERGRAWKGETVQEVSKWVIPRTGILKGKLAYK